MIFAIVYCVLATVFGVLFCFFGYRYLKRLFICMGFLIGALVGYILLSAVLESIFLVIVLSALIGVVCGLLLYYLYVLGIFVTGACFGAVLVVIICMLVGWDAASTYAMVAELVVGITMGVLAVIFRRAIMVLATSFTGGAAVAVNAGFLMYGLSDAITAANYTDKISLFYQANSSWVTIAALGLGVAGCLIQFLFTAPDRKIRKK